MSDKINILLVDDHMCLNEGMARLLNMEKDLRVVGMATTLAEATLAFAKSRPDVVLLDLNLGENESGFTFLEQVKSANPMIRVIIVTTFDGGTFRTHAQSLGADGYVAKGASFADILKAIRHAVDSDPVRPGGTALRLSVSQADRASLFKNLSANEKKVLRLLIDGMSQKEIAAKIGVSPSSVGTYVQRAREKFGAKSLAHLVSIAESIVSEDESK